MRRIVLDTNCLIQIVSPHSKYFPVWEAFMNEKIQICVSTEILLEYQEILSRLASTFIANTIVKAITNNPHTVMVNPTFRFNIITEDFDDNKFVDCAIIGQAEYIVTNDKHFEEVRKCPFPKVDIQTLSEFAEDIKNLGY